MQIKKDDRIIEKLLEEKNELIYNLIFTILEQDNPVFYSDKKSYLTAQSSISLPMWLYVNNNFDNDAKIQLCSVLSDLLKENDQIRINAQAEYSLRFLEMFAEEQSVNLINKRELFVYFARKISDILCVGKLIVAEEKHKKELAELIKEMYFSANIENISDEEAYKIAEDSLKNNEIYLWFDKKIVSMVKVIRCKNECARLSLVVTKSKERGKGYAKMLVSKVSKILLEEKYTPILYADANNFIANRCYKGIGFEKIGEINEFLIKK